MRQVCRPAIEALLDLIPTRLKEALHAMVEYAGSLREQLYYRHIYSRPAYLRQNRPARGPIFACDKGDSYQKIYPELFSDRALVETRAARICDHIFDLLGSGPHKLSSQGPGYNEIDWHLDFKSGYRWDPDTFFRKIRFGRIDGPDVIVPWELSRFQDAMVLAQAGLISNDTAYVEEFQNQLTDWIDNNAYCHGINWYSAMDVAIRAANWLLIKDFFATRFDFPPVFEARFRTSIYDHGRYIRSHLPYIQTGTTNHYVAALVGLLFIAVYYPFLNEAAKWQAFALKNLEHEIEKQVYPDGADYEASTSYHLLVLEAFFYALLLCERAGLEMSGAYRDKVKKMFECVIGYLKPDGTAPQTGDNDNGRFFKFCPRAVLDHSYLLCLATIYFQDRAFKLKPFEYCQEAFWIFGREGKGIYDRLPYRDDTLSTRSFPCSGWYVLRHENDYCFVSCGPSGQGNRGGHAHNDKLSFELVIGNRDLIVDAGTFCYTADPRKRNLFRSTSSHNTIAFNGLEQNELSATKLFHLPERVSIHPSSIGEDQESIAYSGRIDYAHISHRRTIRLDKRSKSWTIEDELSTAQPVHARLRFHLAPDLFYRHNGIFSKRTRAQVASIEAQDIQLGKHTYDYSPAYGVKQEAECIVAEFFLARPHEKITTRIAPVASPVTDGSFPEDID